MLREQPVAVEGDPAVPTVAVVTEAGGSAAKRSETWVDALHFLYCIQRAYLKFAPPPRRIGSPLGLRFGGL